MRTALRSRPLRTFLLCQLLLTVQFWFPVWLLFLLDLGFPIATALLADAVFRVVSVVCEFPMGLLGDRIGRRRTYLVLAAGTAVTFALITLIQGTGTLFAAWTVWGVLWALTSGAASTYLYELCAQDELDVRPAQVFGLANAVSNVAVLGSLVAAGYLYGVDPRAPFAITALFGAIAFGLALTLPDIAGSRLRSTAASMLADVRRAVGLRGVQVAVALGAILLLFGWSARILFQPLALELAMSPQATGWMYTAFAAVSVLGGLAAARFGGSNRRVALGAGFLLVLAALGATAAAPTLGPFLFLPVLGFGYALATTVLEVLTNEVTPAAVRATVFSLVACVAGLGIAVARPLLGVLSDSRSAAWAFGCWALVGVVLVALALWLVRRVEPTAVAAPVPRAR